MLKRLHIRNLALIEEIEIDWEKGFNVLTGETGAGKSITVEALLLILGERASADLIREGHDKGQVEATFEFKKNREIESLLADQGLDGEDQELVIRREVSSDGKSRAFVNGSQVNVSFLKNLGEHLIDLHGQHEHQSLLKPQSQRDFLDIFADLMNLRGTLKEKYDLIQAALKKKIEFEQSLADRERQLDFLRFQEKEISILNYEEGEDERLKEEHNVLSHSEKIREILARMDETFDEASPSLSDHIAQLLGDVGLLSEFDETLKSDLSGLEEIQIRLQDLQSLVKSKFHDLDGDPEKLKWLQERLFEINRLKKKYGENLPVILADLRNKISDLEKGEDAMIEVNKEIAKLQAGYDEKAAQITKQRKAASLKLGKLIVKDLEELGMKGSSFDVRVEETAMGPYGRDHITFFISTNTGQSLRPLHEIVSGGELSRIMLSIKTLLTEKDFVPILIFDEIDVNLGGQTAHRVALKLKEVSKHHQIIVITHLAQIAAYADHHYYVEKSRMGKKVSTKVRTLVQQDRTKEIARMLGGDISSDAALNHAEEILIAGQKA